MGILHSTQLDSAAAELDRHQRTLDAATAALQAELDKIDLNLKDEVIELKQREARAKHEPQIRAALKEITDLDDALRSIQPHWENKAFIASQATLTKHEGTCPFNDPVDVTAENLARLAKLQQYTLMGPDMLKLCFDQAKKTGNLAEMGLLDLVNRSRETRAAFDMNTVEIPLQERAMGIMHQAKVARRTAENVWKEASTGHGVNPVDRINAARGAF